MKAGLALARLKELAIAGAKQAKLRKRLTILLAVILFLQLYFVRELIAAELLFGLGFLVLLTLVGIFYAIGFIGEQTFNGLEAGYRVTAPVARRAYTKMEELSKKPFRHPRSESVQ
jgi:fatty acid desaturase